MMVWGTPKRHGLGHPRPIRELAVAGAAEFRVKMRGSERNQAEPGRILDNVLITPIIR